MRKHGKAVYAGMIKKRGIRRLVAVITLSTLVGQPVLAADIVADPNAGSYKPMVDRTANGLPLVQITDPSAAGVSRNQYTQFNVGSQGVILNNSLTVTNTQQAGCVAANPLLSKTPARIILNEVTGSSPSSLRGYTEVAGQRAEVIIANPDGITCDGCGFINTSRGLLTTGTPVFGGSGSLDAFRVTGGNITVSGAGFNAANMDQVDLLSRTVNLNASLWANYLNVVTGTNQISYADLNAEPIVSEGVKPEVSIDVASLGGMYANKIRLVGTERGVGVVNNGTLASAGDFALSSEGKIMLGGQTTSGANMSLHASGDVFLMDNGNTGQPSLLYSGGEMSIVAGGEVRNNSLIIADQLTVFADQMINDGTNAAIAVKNSNGAARFFVRGSVANRNGATIYSLGDIVVAGGQSAAGSYTRALSLLNESATIEAARDIQIFADTITNKKRVFATDEILDPALTRYFNNVSIPIPDPQGIKFVKAGYIRATATYTETTTVTQTTGDSPAAMLLAGRDMTLTAKTVANEYSTIAAGNNLMLNVDGELSNTARGGFNVSTSAGKQYLIYTYESRRCDTWSCWTNWPEDLRVYDYYKQTVTQHSFLPGASNISAGNLLTVNAGNVINTVLGPGTGASTAPTIVNDHSYTSGSYSFPTSGIFRITPDPTSRYLIEANPLFTDVRVFMSSDYMLDRLAYDPEHTQKRLGDGFYEQKLVLDQVTQLTGRRYLEGYGSAEEQFRALMDAGVTYAKEFNLSVGVGLTAEQMASLTADLVWLVEQEVRGYRVLVPKVYLARLGERDLRSSGALIAANDLQLKASNDLFNSGTLRAGERAALQGVNILNRGGKIDAAGLVTLASTEDIINESGVIAGERIALDAGRDIRNETLTTAFEQGAINQTVAQSKATINSSGDLTLTARRDVAISGGDVNAQGNADIQAGRDISVGGVEERDRVAVVYAGGGFYQRDNTKIVAGTITSGGNMTMTAANDVSLAGAEVAAGKDVALAAGNNISLTALRERESDDIRMIHAKGDYTRIKSDDETVIGTSLRAGGNVTIAAVRPEGAETGGNVLVEGSSIAGQGAVSIVADNDVTIKEATEHHESLLEMRRSRKGTFSSKTVETRDLVSEDLVAGSSISGSDVSVVSGKDIAVRGSGIGAANSLILAADNSVTIDAAKESRYEVHERREEKKSGLNAVLSIGLGALTGGTLNLVSGATSELVTEKKTKNWSRTSSYDETAVGSTLQAGGNVTVVAGKLGTETVAAASSPSTANVTVAGSGIRSETGAVILAAENDVAVVEAREQHTRNSESRSSKKGTLTSKTTQGRDLTEQDLAVESSISGETVTVAAGADAAVRGSSVVGTNDVSIAAVGDVSITAAQQTHHEEHQYSKKKNGVTASFGSGGAGVFVGQTSEKSRSGTDSVDHVGSTVGSVSGSVEIAAGKDATITASEVISSAGTDISGKNVIIDSAYNSADSRSKFESKSVGINVQAGNPVLNQVGKAYDSVERIDKVEDDRLKALYAYRAGRAVYDGYEAATGKDATSVSVSVGVTASKSSSESETKSSNAVGSRIVTDGDLNITATGSEAGDGDLTVVGSAMEGKNIALQAARDITLKSAVNTFDSTSTSKNASGGVGVKVGVSGEGEGGISVYAQGSYGRGNTDEHSVTHTETIVTAKETLSIESGRDTTLKGAQANADRIVAQVGRDLKLESEQDTETYKSKNQSAGGGVSYAVIGTGSGVDASYSRSKTDSTYRSVVEQTGLFAGQGGFDINVGKNTDLKGAVIASKAEADKNRLSTETLTYSDIENRAEYKTTSEGISAGYSASTGINQAGEKVLNQKGGVLPVVGIGASDQATSTTHAAISPATIEVRSNPAQDLSNLSRDPETAHKALEKIFDKKSAEERQELARVFGEEAFRLVGDIAQHFTAPYEEAELKHKAAKNAARQAEVEGDAEGLAKAEAAMQEAQAQMDANRSNYETWKEGSVVKTALHAAVGGIQAEFGGGNALSGLVGAGTAEATRGLTQEHSKEVQQWVSVIIGSAAGRLVGDSTADAYTGAATALDGEKYNRQLHISEQQWIKSIAKYYAAKNKGMTEDMSAPVFLDTKMM